MRFAACLLALALAVPEAAVEAASGAAILEAPRVEHAGLRSVAEWLRSKGSPGYLGADVAEAMGIANGGAGASLPARQRGFREEEVLRIAQVPADEERDYVLFMVQRPGEVYFYLSSLRHGLRKAFVSIPAQNLVAPLEPQEARRNFRAELLYWEDKAATY